MAKPAINKKESTLENVKLTFVSPELQLLNDKIDHLLETLSPKKLPS